MGGAAGEIANKAISASNLMLKLTEAELGKIKVLIKSILVCKYLHNGSSDLNEIRNFSSLDRELDLGCL